MAINIKNLQERIQKKIFSVSPSTPTADLGDIVEAATLATGSLRQYAIDSDLPSTISSQAQIAYVKKDNSIKHKSANTTTWKTLTSNAYAAGAAAPGAPSGSQVQGTAYGFSAGGGQSDDPTDTNKIDRYSFASDGNATDYGDLTVRSSMKPAGNASSTHGYNSGGYSMTLSSISNVIERFPFSAAANGTDVGDLVAAQYGLLGQSSETDGYTVGGTPNSSDVINKFPFASATTNSTDVGNATPATDYYSMGASSSTHGYTMGGLKAGFPPVPSQQISKRPFASDGNNSAVPGTLLATTYGGAGNSSETHGYASGGFSPGSPAQVNVIQKFPFAAEDDATDVGDLTQILYFSSGSNSNVSGYVHGGGSPPGSTPHTRVNVIQKFSYSSDANATDVGDLTQVNILTAEGGIQV